MNKVVAETESIEQARKILDREKMVRGAKMDRKK